VWPLWAALALVIGIAVLAYGLESVLLSVPLGLEQVTVTRIEGGAPQDEAPAAYRHFVTRPDGSTARLVSRSIHRPGDVLFANVVRGRLTGRLWLIESMGVPAPPARRVEGER
jgi:hypothetical protein